MDTLTQWRIKIYMYIVYLKPTPRHKWSTTSLKSTINLLRSNKLSMRDAEYSWKPARFKTEEAKDELLRLCIMLNGSRSTSVDTILNIYNNILLIRTFLTQEYTEYCTDRFKFLLENYELLKLCEAHIVPVSSIFIDVTYRISEKTQAYKTEYVFMMRMWSILTWFIILMNMDYQRCSVALESK